jgi:proline iminopeptidase
MQGFEYYYYDQLGSYLSDQPNDTSLWKIDRFVEEVEQVRKALKLDSSNFYLYGKSWGGVLSIEYALKYQKNLKGLIISNMVSSSSAFNKYFNEVLVPQMNPEAVAEIIEIEKNRDFTNPKYMGLVMNEFTTKFMFRKPLNEWPGFAFKYMQHTNNNISNLIWGSSTFSITGTLSNWNRANDLKHINIPTLTIGATFDYMNPEHLKWMAGQVKSGRFLLCPKGSHYAMYEDQEVYFKGMIQFIKDVDQGLFKSE